ncbi:MAG: hypothetical protein JNK48_07395 [Bryobacterales bacterium]|nr:hypothetical protein [Bryobacterales bacterium]
MLSLWITGLLAVAAYAQTAYLPVRDIRAGMKGYGLTVFQGEKVERFEVEILGVLENAGPRQNVILARLSGGPLAHTGVMQGMSGSPVYIDGKLIGAVALAFTLSKDPIAGIRPFEEMLKAEAVPRRVAGVGACLVRAGCGVREAHAWLEAQPASGFAWGESRMTEIATPVSFSGFTSGTLEAFGAVMKTIGLEPRQGVSGGGGSRLPAGDPSSLRPGSMISAMLVTGDMSVGADGTVTHIDGKTVYAFGHRFVSIGELEMPFASSEVLTLLPNLSTSFKISTARKMLGTITHDYSTAVRGELGRTASLLPVSITVRGGGRLSRYDMEIVRDAALTPFLMQMTAYAALDATERTIGAVSIGLKQAIEFAGGRTVRSSNIYSGEFNMPMLAAQSGAVPVGYAMQTGFADLAVKRVTLEFEAAPRRRQTQIEDIMVARKSVRAGETIPLIVTFATEGRRFTRTVPYSVPKGFAPGTLHFTASDALIANFNEFRLSIMSPPRSAASVLKLLESLRDNTKAYIRVWRAEPSYQSQGEDLPSPPPSAAMVLGRSQGAGSIGVGYSSKIAELSVDLGDLMVSGTHTVSVEVKE